MHIKILNLNALLIKKNEISLIQEVWFKQLCILIFYLMRYFVNKRTQIYICTLETLSKLLFRTFVLLRTSTLTLVFASTKMKCQKNYSCHLCCPCNTRYNLILSMQHKSIFNKCVRLYMLFIQLCAILLPILNKNNKISK